MLQENSAMRAATAGTISPVCSEPLCKSSSGTTGFGKSLTPDMTIPLILRIALFSPPHIKILVIAKCGNWEGDMKKNKQL